MFSGPASGIWSNPNPFSSAPAGSLAVADNVVFTAPGVIESRRGYADDTPFGTTGSLADAMAFYGSSLLVAYDLTKVAVRGGGLFTDLGSFAPNGSNRMRFEPAARSMFFNAADGVRMYDGSIVTHAGAPEGLNITGVNAAANGWQLPNTAVAYRYTVCRKDAFGRIIEGAPSGRFILRNYIVSTFGLSGVTRSGGNTVHATSDLPHGLSTGDVVTLTPGEADFAAGSYTVTVDNSVQFHYTNVGANVSATMTQVWNITRSAALVLWLPGEGHAGTNFPGVVTTDDFLRLYRSEMTLTAAEIPSDELFQCYETPYVTAANITAGYVAVADIAPESVLEVPLNTNPNTGDGSLGANFQPPIAEDMAYWQNQMWYLNTTGRHSLEFSLIGTGAPDGLQIGDTITIAFAAAGPELAYTAAAASAGTDFEVSLWGDPGFNVEQTALALVQTINGDTSNEAIVARYVSSETGLPGRIRLEALLFGDPVEMTVYSSRATAWTPQLPTFVTPLWPPLRSTNNRHAARVWYSKVGQPEAVPLLNYEQIDADNFEGLRLAALKYRLLVFKTDGIYFIPTGQPVTYQKLSEAVLIAPDSVAKMGDVVYALTDMGIAAISDSGISFISTPIDDTLTKLSSTASIASLRTRTVGVGYRSARQYICWLIEQSGTTVTADNNQAFVYSTLSGMPGIASGFTRFTFGARCSAHDLATDTIWYAPTDNNLVRSERKTQTNADYCDSVFSVTVVSSVGTAVTVTNATAVAAGDVIEQGGRRYQIASVEGNVLTTRGSPGFAAASAIVYRAIECELIFNDLTDGTPADMKMWLQCSFLFDNNSMHDVVATFASEIHPAQVEVVDSSKGWGEFSWGEQTWGGPNRQIQRVQPLPPQTAVACQMSVGFWTRQALASFRFMGIDMDSTDDTEANRG